VSAHRSASIDGTCSPAFDRVRDAFEANFRQRDEIGAAVAVWVDGQLVVNLWGGTADAKTQRPWQHDTLVSIFSGSKALTSTCIHLLADRGELDLDSPVADYWPEFAQAGKQDITVATVLGHRSGVLGPAPGSRRTKPSAGTSSATTSPRPNPGGRPAPPRAITW
jgi:CubicO group peptidase (beta-lactamase class C family)